jgi:hypothetical protein
MTNRKNTRYSDVPDDVIDMALELERAYLSAIRRTYKKIAPQNIQDWQINTPGIGDLLVAELLGIIGDPRVAVPKFYVKQDENFVLATGEPYVRNVRQLYAYCGHGDPMRRRRRGMSADAAKAAGDPIAKRTVHLMAESCVKVKSGPYNEIYYERKDRYAESHPEWTKGHCHNAALRYLGKMILRDIWRLASGLEPTYGK